MFQIIKNTNGTLKSFRLTKNDSASFLVQVVNPVDGQPYSFQTNDTINFVVSKFYTSGTSLINVSGIPILGTSYANFYIQGSDTVDLNLGTYLLQVILLQADGSKHTIVFPESDVNGVNIPNFELAGTLTGDIGVSYNPTSYYPYSSQLLTSTFIGILNYPMSIVVEPQTSAFITALKTTTQSITTSESIISFNAVSTSSYITNDNGVLTFSKNGHYYGSLELSVSQNASPYLWTCVEYLPVNSSVWVVYELTGTRTRMGADGQTSIGLRGLIAMSAGDKIRIKAKLDSSGSLSLVSNQTTISGQTITQYPARLSVFEV